MTPRLIAFCCCLCPQLVWAQYLAGMTVDKEKVAIEEPFKLVVSFTDRGSVYCGLRVNFGDGEVREVRIDHTPFTLSKKYAAAGRYEIQADGKFLPRGLMTAIGCLGSAQLAYVEVTDAEAEAARRSQAQDLKRQKRQLEEKERRLRLREAELEREREQQQRKAAERPAPAPPPPAPAPAIKKPTPAPAPPASAPKPKPKDKSLTVF